MLRGGILSESDDLNPIARPEMTGRVLYERFLVESDLTDRCFGSGFSSLAVKDLKNFCRDAAFKTLAAQPQAFVGGPTFQQVCEVLARLRHPNIEEVLETGLLLDGRPYALTTLLTGRTLAEVVRDDGRLELARIASIVEQLVDALAAAHSVKVLHCDIRPANVVLTDVDGHEKTYLVNFGAAWPVDVRGATLENLQAGSETLSYAAPELHAKLGHRSIASDIFSLAAVAYRLVAGQVPFAGEDRVTLLRAINAGHVIPPTECRTDISSEAENLILAGLQFEPAWRPHDAEDYGIRLARALRHVPRPTFVPGPTVSTQPTPEPVAAVVRTEKKTEEKAEAVPDPAEPRRVHKEARLAVPVSDRAVAWALIVLLLAGALSIPIGQTLLAEERTTPAITTMRPQPAPNRPRVQLRYWFEEQAGSGPSVDSERHKAQLFLSASDAGGVFVISETETPEGGTAYRVVFPAGDIGVIEAGKPLPAGSGPTGDEKIWIVWTPADQDDLTPLHHAVAGDGAVPEADAGKLRHFLERNRNLRVAVSSDTLTGQAILEGSGERLVYRIEPEQK